jgi:hypothetical protein
MTSLTRAATPIALLGALLLTGCLDYEQELVLFPDGSGKVTRRLAVKRDALHLVRALTKGKGAPADPLAEFADPDRLRAASKGVAAWEGPVRGARDGWDEVRVTAYFEDVNEVRLFLEQPSDGVIERRLDFAAAYVRQGAGGRLEIDPTSRDLLHPDDPRLKPILPFLKDARARFVVRLPGTVEKAEGFSARKGREAEFVLDHALLLSAQRDPKGEASRELDRLLDARPRLEWSDGSAGAEELAAFRKAFDAARGR